MSPEDLRARWNSLTNRIVGSKRRSPGKPDELFAALDAGYTAPHRFYHSWQHVAECFAWLDRCTTESWPPAVPDAQHWEAYARRLPHSPDGLALEFALFFHDAVCDPRADDNEERSALLARESLASLGASTHLTDAVQELVLATDHLGRITGWRTGMHASQHAIAIIQDVDLSILGAEPARFREYEAQIRSEYEHVPPDQYRTRRREVARWFLRRPRIYGTAFFALRLENRARANLNEMS